MSDVFVEGRSAEKATLLLAAAADLDLDPAVVRTTSKGYLAPGEVAKAAGLAEDEESGAPAKSASKKAWVQYAVSQGADEAEAEQATKDDLIEQYGDKE